TPYTGLASIRLTEPCVGTVDLIEPRRGEQIAKSRAGPHAAAPASINSEYHQIGGHGIPEPKALLGSQPAGITHSTRRSLPLRPITLRQFRNGMTAWSSPQMTGKFDMTYASPPPGMLSKASPPTKRQRSVNPAFVMICCSRCPG